MFDDFDDGDDELFSRDESSSGTSSEPSLKPPRENPHLTGHAEQEQKLLSLFNQGHLPHALIFAGPEGIGKSTFAFRLARFLLKHGGADSGQDSLFGDAPAPATGFGVAEDDPVFRRVASAGHPDLLTIERPMDDKKGVRKNSVDVDTVRKIAPFLRMTSSDGGWRIVIVDDAETMNRNAQNAILKILEEPPEKALLILICHRLGAMIPTIRSRCRTLHFQPLQNAQMIDLVKQGASYIGPEEAELLADMADGSVGRALTLHEEGGLEAVEKILSLLSKWPQWEWPLIHQTAENLGRPGSDAQYQSFVDIMKWVFQSTLIAKAGGASRLPKTLRTSAIQGMMDHYSLEQWTGICDKLNTHFTAIETGNLDKRQGVIGAFSLIA